MLRMGPGLPGGRPPRGLGRGQPRLRRERDRGPAGTRRNPQGRLEPRPQRVGRFGSTQERAERIAHPEIRRRLPDADRHLPEILRAVGPEVLDRRIAGNPGNAGRPRGLLCLPKRARSPGLPGVSLPDSAQRARAPEKRCPLQGKRGTLPAADRVPRTPWATPGGTRVARSPPVDRAYRKPEARLSGHPADQFHRGMGRNRAGALHGPPDLPGPAALRGLAPAWRAARRPAARYQGLLRELQESLRKGASGPLRGRRRRFGGPGVQGEPRRQAHLSGPLRPHQRPGSAPPDPARL